MAQSVSEIDAVGISHATDADASRGRLRSGLPVLIVSIGAREALIETEQRLRPGTTVELQIGEPIQLCTVRALVARCCVASVRPAQVLYRGALIFEKELHIAGLSLPAGS